MKCKILIDPSREEEVLIYAHSRTPLTEEIEQLVTASERDLIGYSDREMMPLSPAGICCFISEDNKVYAVTAQKRWQLRERLYQIEERADSRFVRINQSCIVNTGKILRFETSIGGALMVILQGGYKDYVSRRQMKSVKERMGLKK